MSNLDLGFLAPWQPKQVSLRMGAMSLMKLTGPAAAWAEALGGAARSRTEASTTPRVTHSQHKQMRDRNIGRLLREETRERVGIVASKSPMANKKQRRTG